MPDFVSSSRAPEIVVIVPAHGVAHLLGETIESLQAQTLAEWECVVVDDGDTGAVADAARPYLGDPRIRLLATDNAGVAAARNRAIAQTSAPLLALLDGDDLYRPRHLERMVAALLGDPEASIVTCNARIFGCIPRERLCVDCKQGSGDGVTGSLADVLERSFNVYIGSAFRRADFDALGGFDPGLTHAEDFDFWVRLLMKGGHVRYLDEVLGEYRVRAGSASASGEAMILGNLAVYAKALAALPAESTEAGICRTMIAANRDRLAFEDALTQVIAGDTKRGLPRLHAARLDHGAPLWSAAFALWRIVPALAPPMLRWRRAAHSRGTADTAIPSLASLGRTARARA